MIKHLPNTLTTLNLLFGSLAIVLAFNDQLRLSATLILLAFHADIFDGLSARLLKVESAMGKELDSLADIVSFGLAPSVVLHQMMKNTLGIDQISLELGLGQLVLLSSPFLLTIFAGLRLAKFNIDEEQKNVFIGLPTPANALMVLALPLIAYRQPDSFVLTWFEEPWVILLYTVLVSVAMVSPIRLYSLKLSGFGLKNNIYRYVFGLLSLTMILSLWHTGLFFTIPFYFIVGILLGQLQKKGIIT